MFRLLLIFRCRLDPRELDILLGEVVLLSSRTELYLGFLRRRLKVNLLASTHSVINSLTYL